MSRGRSPRCTPIAVFLYPPRHRQAENKFGKRMQVVAYDGSPSSAGAVLFAARSTNTRVFVEINNSQLTSLPSQICDCCGSLGRRGDVAKGEPAWISHYGPRAPANAARSELISEAQAMDTLFEWAYEQTGDRPDEVMVDHGIAACQQARELGQIVCDDHECKECDSFKLLAAEYGLHLD